MDYPKYHFIMLSEQDKKRLTKISHETIDFMLERTTNKEELAYLLKMMVESFQISAKAKIPIE